MFSTVHSSISCYPSPLPPPLSPSNLETTMDMNHFRLISLIKQTNILLPYTLCVCVCVRYPLFAKSFGENTTFTSTVVCVFHVQHRLSLPVYGLLLNWTWALFNQTGSMLLYMSHGNSHQAFAQNSQGKLLLLLDRTLTIWCSI